MPGLLADIFSAGDSAKRKLRGLLADPVGELGLLSARINEDMRRATDLQETAYPRGRGPNAQTAQGREGFVAQNLAREQLAELAGNMGLAGATVWHGSHHKFAPTKNNPLGEFDATKIGTGEGAQAKGYGHYLGGIPEVSQTYRTAGSDAAYSRVTGGMTPMEEYAFDRVTQGVSGDDLFSAMHQRYGQFLKKDSDFDAFNAAIKKAETSAGHLYKVDLPDEHIAKMLDWDKPLSQQAPEVANTLQSLVNDVAGSPNASRAGRDISRAFNPYSRADLLDEISKRYGWKVKGDTLVKPDGSIIPESAIQSQLKMRQRGKVYDSAGDLYRDLAQIQGSDASVSAALRNNGIPGIRYLDGGSRSAGQGSSNFVAFDPEMIRILERNGQATGLEPWKPGEYRLKDLIGKE